MKLRKVKWAGMASMLVIVVFSGIQTINAQDEGTQRKLGYFEKGELLGEVVLISDTLDDGNVKIGMESHYTINPTVELKVDENSTYILKNDSIIAMFSLAKINDRSRYKIVQNWSWDLNKYERKVNARSKELDLPIQNAAYLNLFFTAPEEGVQNVYSDIFDKVFDVSKNSDTKYTVTDHLDRSHTFEYNQDGQFKEAELTNSTGVYTIKEIKK